jgi:2-amino-4-hydroxy-6-hydroxymethyldihydropteridine diphosphokinase
VENIAFIALGSNMGDRFELLKKAIQLISGHRNIQLVNSSSIYETDPVGYEDQDLFLNMVVKVRTDLSPTHLLDACLQMELELGRKREIKWGPRTIDLDILLYNQENIETEKLIIPHPRMGERAFVIIPLLEIEKDIIIQGMEKTLHFYLSNLPDKEGVRIWKRKNGEGVFAPTES